MALWVVRAGEHGEQEEGVLENNVVAIGWYKLENLSEYHTFDSLYDYYKSIHPREEYDKETDYDKSTRLLCGEVWAFLKKIEINDFVILPSKKTDKIFIGKIIGNYEYKQYTENVKHTRKVTWLKTINKTDVPELILKSFNTGLTVFNVEKNNAEKFVNKVVNNEKVLDRFEEGELLIRNYLLEQTGIPFIDFNHPTLVKEIEYKQKINQNASEKLQLDKWSEWIKSIGKILESVKNATEVDPKNNNLLETTGKRGPNQNSNACLYQIKDVKGFEKVLYDFFCGGPSNPKYIGPRFNNLSEFISRNKAKNDWRLLSYFLFLFEPERFFPIGPRKFDKALSFYDIPEKLSYEEKTWEKYSLIINLIEELRPKLSAKYGRITILQAQSYLWVLVQALEQNSSLKKNKAKEFVNKTVEGKVWIYSVDQKNWEVVTNHNIWASNVSIEKISERIHQNDYVIFFVIGTKKFGGIFKFSSDWYTAKSVVWPNEVNKVRYLSQIKLEPIAIRNVDLWDVAKKLDYFPDAENKRDSSLKLQGKGGYPSNKESLSRKDFETILNEMKPHYFVALGPWNNWEHSLSRNPILWGVKSDSSGTNIGEFDRLYIGDFIFFYVILEKPSKFSKYGFFGVGKVVRKCPNQKELYWPNETNEAKYTHRFQIQPIKIFENDDDLLWFDGLPNTKGLAGIKSDNPGLAPLLDAVKNKWNINLDENNDKFYLLQNNPDYPVLRKAEIDKIFGIYYSSGIHAPVGKNYVILFSSLAGVYRDKIGDEFITYTGKGQKGDQTLTAENEQIAKSKRSGKKLYFLAEIEGPNGKRTHDYQFLGEVKYLEHSFEEEPSEHRKVIRFKLKRIHGPWNLQENNDFTGFDFIHENTQGLKNNSKLISFKKTDNDYYFYGYGHVGSFEQDQCTEPLRNLFLPITSKISPFCSEPILNLDEIQLKEKLQKIISGDIYKIGGQKSIVLISILYWLSKTKFNESSLVEYLKNLNVVSDSPMITELELLVHNSRLFADYVLIYKLYQSLGLLKFEIIDRIGYHIKRSLEMNTNEGRLISYFSQNKIDILLSEIEPDRAKILLYNLLKDNLDNSTLADFWSCLYGNYYTIKCPEEIQNDIRNQPDFEPESPTIQINQEIYDKLMSQFSEISETKAVKEGKLRMPTEDEVESGIKEIQKELLIEGSIIEEIVTHLASGRHILLAGPVGTGKTRLSQLIPDKFWTENCGYFADVRTATADWTTQDVIGGISPKITDNPISPLTYEFENGCVTDTVLANYEEESRKTDHPIRHTSIHKIDKKKKQFNGTWLVIDEFNRADIDKALGQLFTALEYGDLKIQDIRLEKTVRTVKIPEDYRIIGTLNTADKHYLFNLSDALKRRFAYVEIPIPSNKDREREIFLAVKGALNVLDETKFEDIIKIEKDSDAFNFISDPLTNNLNSGYNSLELVRQFKPLGTAVLKLIYQYLLASEKMGNSNSFDNAINANLLPQLETLPKPTIRILYEYLFSKSNTSNAETTYPGLSNFLNDETQKEQYHTGFEAILRYLDYSEDKIKESLKKFANGEIPTNLTQEITEMKKSHKMTFGESSLFKKSLEEILKQSEF